jgi:hypothetical protein
VFLKGFVRGPCCKCDTVNDLGLNPPNELFYGPTNALHDQGPNLFRDVAACHIRVENTERLLCALVKNCDAELQFVFPTLVGQQARLDRYELIIVLAYGERNKNPVVGIRPLNFDVWDFINYRNETQNAPWPERREATQFQVRRSNGYAGDGREPDLAPLRPAPLTAESGAVGQHQEECQAAEPPRRLHEYRRDEREAEGFADRHSGRLAEDPPNCTTRGLR